MTLYERLSQISPFRWRLEWALLVLVAVSIVLGEQAREQREKDPYLIVQGGRSAAAAVRAGRTEVHTVSPRWTRTRQEVRTFLDLEWLDRDGIRRTIDSYLLDVETIVALRIDANANVWPTEVRILYLDQDRGAIKGVALPKAMAYQSRCRPQLHCRVLVLAPNSKTQAELDADLADYLAVWAPRGLWLGLAGFLALLALRLGGIVYNRPSLE